MVIRNNLQNHKNTEGERGPQLKEQAFLVESVQSTYM